MPGSTTDTPQSMRVYQGLLSRQPQAQVTTTLQIQFDHYTHTASPIMRFPRLL